MTNPEAVSQRVVQRSKFFFVGDRKFVVKGATYGPFRPAPATPEVFLPEPSRVRQDFALMRELGANTVRLYHVPPRWFLDELAGAGLRAMVTVPWQQHVAFLNHRRTVREIRGRVREAARAVAGHPAMFSLLVGNEIPADICRWLGAEVVVRFLDELVEEVRQEDPGLLVSYANYPSTEYILPRATDFLTYNVYLHREQDFRNYLARLQNLAEERPLLLGEFGMDTLRHTEEEQAEMLSWHIANVGRGGLAGTVLFAWTDEWFTGGHDITDWAFGLVTRERKPKKAFHAVRALWTAPGGLPELPAAPKATVVVCSYNGGQTLKACLESLDRMNYPDYEVVLVDDGSRDNSQALVREFEAEREARRREAEARGETPRLPKFINLVQPNLGLSAARNNGMRAGSGEVIAYTDSDCMADRDWLYYLVTTLLRGDFAAVGGPNVSPPAHNWIQACVAAAPGSPSHVLLTDTVAEHVPGCNMAYWRWALEAIDGFDAEYRKAGDDVDVCWRLMEHGWQIGFSPSAVVWHHRRFTVKAYFAQQRGYGEAESLLRFKHPVYFAPTGGAKWKGAVYGVPRFEHFFSGPTIYRGVFGSGLFQCIYPRRDAEWAGIASSLEWALAGLFIFVLSAEVHDLRVVPLVMSALTLAVGLSWMVRARIEPRHDSVLGRLVLLYLAVAQPWARSWARYTTWIRQKRTPGSVMRSKEGAPHGPVVWAGFSTLGFWSENGKGRHDLLAGMVDLLESEGWRYSIDPGWTDSDLEVFGNRWWKLNFRSANEYHGGPKVLTRARLVLRLSAFAKIVGGGILTLFVAGLPAIGPRVEATGAAAAGLALFLGYRALRLRRRVAALVHAAAERAGMQPMDRAALKGRRKP